MVKFDVRIFKFLSAEHFRVLTSVEMGMKNHDIVPTVLIESISDLQRGKCYQIIRKLHELKLVTHESIPYDGYKLTYSGYDYLSIRALVQRNSIIAIGKQIGVGKESDVFEAFGPNNEKYVLKLHRLGRTSFRKIKEKRDYLGKRKSASWLYLSRLSALKEYEFMRILYNVKDNKTNENIFPVPKPIDNSRHGVVMSLIEGFPLYHVKDIKKPVILYQKCMQLICKLGEYGLIHCDFNEFNLMTNDNYDLYLIDFPQMISINHKQAKEYFNRDVNCILNYFKKKVSFIPKDFPILNNEWIKNNVKFNLDNLIKASGFNDPKNIEGMKILHDSFASTIKNDDEIKEEKDNENKNEIENENKNESENENESESEIDDNLTEKERWEIKKMEKRKKFEEKRKLKNALKNDKAKELKKLGFDEHKTKNNNEKEEERVLSMKEIRRRVKNKHKNDIKKQTYKRARKTHMKNRDNYKLKQDIKKDSFWG